MEEMNEQVKPYQLTELKAEHLFLLTRVVSKAGLKDIADAIKNNIEEAKKNGKGVEVEQIGYTAILDVAAVILAKLPNCQKEVFTFLASISDLNEKQIADMNAADFADMIIDVVQMDGFKDFFTRCARLLR